MKKALLLLASAAMLLVGCAKEKLGPDAGTGEMVTANFTAQMQGMPQTKSVTDGEGTEANRCVMEIYYKGELYTRDVQPISDMKATFTPRLVSNRTYDVLFWADCGEELADKYYKTNAEGLGLQAVEMKATAYAANVDARDAFFAKKKVEVLQQVSSETFTLTRPFAQVNIITTDAAIIKNANLYPDGVQMVYKAPTKFNLLTETLSEEKELTVTGTPYETFDKSSAALTLEMDYLFAGLEKSALDIAFEASKVGESTVTSHSFTNIPVQRNYRTNIKGRLLTTTGDWQATIVPTWNQPDTDVDLLAVEDIEALQARLDAGAEEVHLLNAPTEDSEILISKLYGAASTLVITVPDTDKKITIKTKADGSRSYPALKLVGNVADLVINLPESTVTLEGTYGVIEASTAANTLFIVKGATFETLNVKKGKVVLYDVDLAMKTTFANNCGIELHLENLAALKAYAAADQEIIRKKGVTAILDADIDLNNEAWTPISGDTFAFDGNGHTVSNLKLDTEAKNVGFFGAPTSAKISNLTIDGASVTGIGHVAVLAGHGLCTQIENCTVKNATVESKVKDNDDGDKAGAICGYLSAESSASIKNCHVENVTVKAYRDLAAISGYANGTSPVVTGNTAKNVRVICNTDINYNDYTSVEQFDARQVVGEHKASAIVENNTCDNVTVEYSNLEGIFELTANSYAITSVAGLNKVNDLNVQGSKFILLSDINLGGEAFTPLTTSNADQSVTFDGNGHTISNFVINVTDNPGAGFFAKWSGTIKNLTLDGATVTNTTAKGSRAAVLCGKTEGNSAISNCTVKNSKVYGHRKVGGLVGHAYTSTTIENCTVENVELVAYRIAGGLVGAVGSGDGGYLALKDNTVNGVTVTFKEGEDDYTDQSFGAFLGIYYSADAFTATVENLGGNSSENFTVPDAYSANTGFGAPVAQ